MEEELVSSIIHDATLTIVIMVATIVPVLVLERARRVDNKAVSYAMSLTCSLSMTAVGAFSILPRFVSSGWDVLTVLSDTRLDRFICTFFGTFCCLDLIFGVVFYPKQLDLLTGWVHHGMYLWLMYYLHSNHIQGGFSLFLVEELPTFLLALGNVAKGWRTNLLFGLSFFFTRLVWHGYLLSKFWMARKVSSHALWPIISAAFVLHLHWFYGYVRQQLRRMAKRKRAKAKTD